MQGFIAIFDAGVGHQRKRGGGVVGRKKRVRAIHADRTRLLNPPSSPDLALPPPGLSPFAPGADTSTLICRATEELDRMMTDSDTPRVDAPAAAGFAAAASPAARVHRLGDVIAIVHTAEAGDVALDATAAAAALLDTDTDADADALDTALASLASLPTAPWAMVAFDASTRRVAAARDAAGGGELWWGVSPSGLLVLASTAADAAAAGIGENSSLFPAGGAFIAADTVPSSPGARGFTLVGVTPAPGRLLSFVADDDDDASDDQEEGAAHAHAHRHFREVWAVPRLDAGGALCGAVYRVASAPRFAVL